MWGSPPPKKIRGPFQGGIGVGPSPLYGLQLPIGESGEFVDTSASGASLGYQNHSRSWWFRPFLGKGHLRFPCAWLLYPQIGPSGRYISIRGMG